MSKNSRVIADKFTPMKDKVFVSDLESGPQITTGGLIIPDDNMRDRGIKPRWGKVFAIGKDIKDIKVGDWVLIKHGRWTQKIDLELNGVLIGIWQIEFPDSVELIADEDPRNSLTHNF
jgi:co-chaperonin GroES (HSP10)